ncbi:hypothetical protein EMCRGX_G014716 [Ephydatia muelleri]
MGGKQSKSDIGAHVQKSTAASIHTNCPDQVQKHKLTENDVDALSSFMSSAHLRWRDLARNLDFKHAELSEIVNNPGLTTQNDYFTEMLNKYLKWAPPAKHQPSSEDLITALRGLVGKNAGLMFNDVDLKKCLPIMVRSSFSNQGEICLTTSRIYVQEGIYEKFVERYVELTRAIKVGDPEDPTNTMGALISKEHLAKVKGYVALAREEGCSVLCGEDVEQLELPTKNQGVNEVIVCVGGLPRIRYFMRPAVITNVRDDSMLPFKTEEEVIKRANDVQYGLCACMWTENEGTAHRVAQSMEVGTVWVNCWMVRDLNMPFGGCKMSGVGREGFKDSLEFYTEAKTVCIKH